jgi:hypothetical protein
MKMVVFSFTQYLMQESEPEPDTEISSFKWMTMLWLEIMCLDREHRERGLNRVHDPFGFCIPRFDIIGEMDGFDIVRAFEPVRNEFFDQNQCYSEVTKYSTRPSNLIQLTGRCIRDKYVDQTASSDKKHCHGQNPHCHGQNPHCHNQNPTRIPRYNKHQMDPKRMTRGKQYQKRRY